MKVAAIGDIHGTTKFQDCYDQINNSDKDIDKIIVLGDWFDPYDDIPFEAMLERYHYFIECCEKDDRIVSILGNHDLEGYIICGETHRTAKSRRYRQTISEEITKNLPNSYLVYKIGDWLFSHAGVSEDWFNYVKNYNPEYAKRLLTNQKGWTPDELGDICSFYPLDYSCYGDHTYQGCTWIRPSALLRSHLEGYNQIIAHTQVEEFVNLKNEDPDNKLDVDIWMIDNQRKSEYFTIKIEKSE